MRKNPDTRMISGSVSSSMPTEGPPERSFLIEHRRQPVVRLR
jgi:hypothetical protein